MGRLDKKNQRHPGSSSNFVNKELTSSAGVERIDVNVEDEVRSSRHETSMYCFFRGFVNLVLANWPSLSHVCDGQRLCFRKFNRNN